jgi:hypothetical protein
VQFASTSQTPRFGRSSFADAARAAFFRAVFAVMAVLARVARVTSGAGAVSVNFRHVSRSVRCCCFGHVPENKGKYYGSDQRNRFHRRIMGLALSGRQSETKAMSEQKNRVIYGITSIFMIG